MSDINEFANRILIDGYRPDGRISCGDGQVAVFTSKPEDLAGAIAYLSSVLLAVIEGQSKGLAYFRELALRKPPQDPATVVDDRPVSWPDVLENKAPEASK